MEMNTDSPFQCERGRDFETFHLERDIIIKTLPSKLRGHCGQGSKKIVKARDDGCLTSFVHNKIPLGGSHLPPDLIV